MKKYTLATPVISWTNYQKIRSYKNKATILNSFGKLPAKMDGRTFGVRNEKNLENLLKMMDCEQELIL